MSTLMKTLGDLGVLPANNLPISPSQRLKIELGRKLFFDTRLSLDHASSCATCHDPKKAFGDGQPLATGFKGKILRRHTPTLRNAVLGVLQFWDGRADGLEAQAMMPIMANNEMRMGGEISGRGRRQSSRSVVGVDWRAPGIGRDDMDRDNDRRRRGPRRLRGLSPPRPAVVVHRYRAHAGHDERGDDVSNRSPRRPDPTSRDHSQQATVPRSVVTRCRRISSPFLSVGPSA